MLNLKRIPGVDRDGRPLYLAAPAARAWMELLEAAAKAGYDLRPTYAYRTKEQQKRLRKQSRRLAARVGFSPHQAGLAVDISGMTESGRPSDLRRWMRREAPQYGFFPTRREPWHWNYRGEAS